jgi:hypothetical protein
MNILQLFQKSKSGDRRIKYVVKGNAKDYNVTFKCGHGCQVVQDPHIQKGWKHTFVGQRGDYVYIAAQSNQPHSEVNVMIYEDGKILNRLAKSGDYPLVQVSGTV